MALAIGIVVAVFAVIGVLCWYTRGECDCHREDCGGGCSDYDDGWDY